ncbi:MAG: dihydrodipicolinate reductase [Pseudomonadales bacterium]|nr:dihydrodipicolinate reductase [Pseudomonadales bacterium]MCP5184452.1 dihydrodipicolinate reductase [Pseudomonadales bacterium]
MSIRVFQWASGTVGRHAARAVLDSPGYSLVGLHVLTPAKVGRDAGEILGTPPTGVRTTGDIAAILRSEADVVLHAPLASLVYGDNPGQDLDDICRLLAGGKDVITVVGYMYPRVHGSTVVDRLEEACRQGGSTFHSTGLNPGWMGDLIPLTMSALSESIEHIHVLEISDFEHYPSPEIMFDSMGFGSSPEAFERNGSRRANWLNGLFTESVQMVADGAGLGVDRVVSTLRTALAETDLTTASGVVKAGTVAAQHWRWAGMAGEEERIAHETVWRIHGSAAPDWQRGKHRVVIRGRPAMKIAFDADYVSDGLLATAMHAVNAIPHVHAASPGIRTFLDLPWIMARRR